MRSSISNTSNSGSTSRERRCSVSVQTIATSDSCCRRGTFSFIPRRFLRLAILMITIVSVTFIYLLLFKHPPAEELMQMNKLGNKDFNLRAFAHPKSEEEERFLSEDKDRNVNITDVDVWDLFNYNSDFNQSDYQPTKHLDRGHKTTDKQTRKSSASNRNLKGKKAWDKFVADHRYTQIGVVFNKCDHPDQQLGTVIMLPDPENGGIKSRTFYNLTLEEELEEGTFHIEVRYNGKALYDNWWELCEMEENLDIKDRTFTCPIHSGHISLVKDKHVPSYLPKGRYQSKAWVTKETNQTIACGFSDFVL